MDTKQNKGSRDSQESRANVEGATEQTEFQKESDELYEAGARRVLSDPDRAQARMRARMRALKRARNQAQKG